MFRLKLLPFFPLNDTFDTLSSWLAFAHSMGLSEILPALAVTVLILASITTASQNASCYFPDGSEATYGDIDYVPCKDMSAGGFTYCCASTDVCTVGGYCLGSAGVFYRGGCTDQTWTSSLCPSLCAEGAILLEHACLIHEELSDNVTYSYYGWFRQLLPLQPRPVLPRQLGVRRAERQ
jgi:hypothetical protein